MTRPAAGRLVDGRFVRDSAEREAMKDRAWKVIDEINAWHGDSLSQHEALVDFVEKEMRRAAAARSKETP